MHPARSARLPCELYDDKEPRAAKFLPRRASGLCGTGPVAGQAAGLFASFVTFLSNKEKLERSPFPKELFAKCRLIEKTKIGKQSSTGIAHS